MVAVVPLHDIRQYMSYKIARSSSAANSESLPLKPKNALPNLVSHRTWSNESRLFRIPGFKISQLAKKRA